jgi:hypothetical protein
MAQPIEIVIRKTQESSSQSGAVALKGDKKSGGASVTDKAITNALINAGKSIANYGVAQFGNMTGYTIAQRNIENALNVASYITQIATTGWVGAIAVGIQLTTQGLNTAVARDKANQQAELLYQRSGNITIDGGRGTYD